MVSVDLGCAMVADESGTIEAVDDEWLLVSGTLLSGRFIDSDLSNSSLLEIFQSIYFMRGKGFPLFVLLDTFLADKQSTLATECFSFVFRVSASFTLDLYLAMDSLNCRIHGLHAVDKESCLQSTHTFNRESGLFATLRTREGLLRGCPVGQLENALLAVVVETREELRLCVAFLADSTGDISLQVIQALLVMSYIFCHSGKRSFFQLTQQ